MQELLSIGYKSGFMPKEFKPTGIQDGVSVSYVDTSGTIIPQFNFAQVEAIAQQVHVLLNSGNFQEIDKLAYQAAGFSPDGKLYSGFSPPFPDDIPHEGIEVVTTDEVRRGINAVNQDLHLLKHTTPTELATRIRQTISTVQEGWNMTLRRATLKAVIDLFKNCSHELFNIHTSSPRDEIPRFQPWVAGLPMHLDLTTLNSALDSYSRSNFTAPDGDKFMQNISGVLNSWRYSIVR